MLKWPTKDDLIRAVLLAVKAFALALLAVLLDGAQELHGALMSFDWSLNNLLPLW